MDMKEKFMLKKKTLICSNFTLKWENHVPCIPSFQAIVRKKEYGNTTNYENIVLKL